MAQYVLRDLPSGPWARFTGRAKREGWPLRPLFLQLIDDYGLGHLTPSADPPLVVASYAWLRPIYRRLAKTEIFQGEFDDAVRWKLLIDRLVDEEPSHMFALDNVPPTAVSSILQWLQETTKLELPEPNRLTMKAIAHIGEGPDLQTNRRVFQYEVVGLPPGQQAWIADYNYRWRLLRWVHDKHTSDWYGNYDTAKEALSALEVEIEEERA